MQNFRKIVVLLLVLSACAAVGAVAGNSQAEFDKVKSLAGNWEGKNSAGNPVHINYRLVSGGSAVMETIDAAHDSQMITVYHLDGDHLMMTHYCMANNQPRMRANASNDPNAIKFTFVDVTNLSSPTAGHMYAHSIVWNDNFHVTQYWTWRQDGKDKVETFELQRVK